MKITHTDIYRYNIPMEPFQIATGTMYYAQNIFIRVHTDAGMYGVGEASPFPVIVGETQETCLALAKDFAKIWKGKDALALEDRLQEMDAYSARNPTAKSAFDMALYDLASKAAGQPLYAYLGGSKRTIETDMTIGIGAAADMAAQAVRYKEQGASVLKIKLGKGVEQDVDRMRQIRKAVGPDIKLRIDANQGWSFDDALLALQAINELEIQFCEQPMRTWYDDMLPTLCQKSPVNIMADESCYHHHDARKLIKAGACNSINIKLAKSGGIYEGLKIYKIAQAAGIPCMIGGMLETRLAVSANLHFAYACPAIEYVDLDSCLVGQLEDPVTEGVAYDGYFMSIADSPGIGADVNEDFLSTCEKWTI